MNMPKDYKTALVTGASKGIGEAISRRLIDGGLTVYGVARSPEGLEKLAAEMDGKFIACPADVTNTDAIMETLGGNAIDVLVNNAGGISSVRPLADQTAEETAQAVALNLTAPLQLMRALLPGMIERRSGHIFNLASTAARSVFTGTTTYAACKAGLEHACRVLRYDIAGSGVRITDLAPGRVETEFYLESFAGDHEALKEKLYAKERALTAQDIAETLWMALCMPSHATLAEIVISPTDQAAGGQVFRQSMQRP